MIPFYSLRKMYQCVTTTRMTFSSGNQSTTKTLYQFPHSLQKSVVADALNSLVGEGKGWITEKTRQASECGGGIRNCLGSQTCNTLNPSPARTVMDGRG